MKTKLHDTVVVRGETCIVEIEQYSCGTVIDEIITTVNIDKLNHLGKIRFRKSFSFTKEEFELLIRCLEYNNQSEARE